MMDRAHRQQYVRYGCQIALRCLARKREVVNGQGKAFIKGQMSVKEMNENEPLKK
jgi:hypothetical protein